LPDIGYADAMLFTITLWIAVAPLAAVGKTRRRGDPRRADSGLT
jgi:hypothetical protein